MNHLGHDPAHDPVSDFVPRPAEGLAHRNVIAMFAARARRSAHQPALRFKEGGVWRTMSWSAWLDTSRALAAGLLQLGVGRGQRVAIVARSSPRWMIADLAIAMAGAVSVPVYPSLAADQVRAILDDSGAVAILADDAGVLDKLRSSRPMALQHAISMGDRTPPQGEPSLTLHGWEGLLASGRLALSDGGLAARLDALATEIRPDDELTYVYTSGATGEPKGAVLTHRNLVFETWAIKNVVPVDHRDEQLMVLPLAHIFARHLTWATVEQGAVTAFAESEDRVYANFQEIAPTFVAGVPRMFEKAYARILREAVDAGGLGQAVFERALEVGRQASFHRQRGEPLPTRLALKLAVAERVLLRRLRERFGGRIRFFVGGGAPLAKEVAEAFHATGMLILQGYGLSETTGATHVNRPDRYRFGTVGPAIPGCDVRLADDGEILIRSPAVFTRYHGRPRETAEAIDGDGWFHTGDIGEIHDGFLTITDRKKDLFKTSTGKYVAPLMVQKRLQLGSGIAHATVVGDGRAYVVALISLDEEALLRQSDREGLGCTRYADLAVHPRIRALVQAHVDEVNAGLSRHERVRGFYIVPRPFSEDTGELTPTRKVKRSVVRLRYAEAIEALYPPDPGARPSGRAPGFSP